MEKTINWKWTALSSILISVLLITVGVFPTHAAAFAVNGSDPTCKDDGSGTSYCTIQAAIDDAASGDTINIAAGTYAETLNMQGKELTLTGAGMASTVIDASSFTGYAVSNFGDNTTVQDLKLIGSDHYGFKISHVSNITLENIRVEDSGKTGVDLNTVSGGSLTNIEVVDTVGGFGIMLLDSNNIQVTDILTSGNPWGGVSVHAINADADAISFSGAFDASEDVALLLEKDPPYAGDFVNLTLPSKFDFIVYGLRSGPDYKQWFYMETLAEAKTFANALLTDPSYTYLDSLIYNAAETEYHVIPGMLIQDAVEAATAGDTVNVDAGTYTEQVVINKDLTLQGSGDPVLVAPSSPATYQFPESSKTWEPVLFAYGGTDDGSGVITGTGQVNVDITGLVVDGNDRVPSGRSSGILLRNVVTPNGVSNNTVQNMSVDGKETFGIMAYGDSDVIISDNVVSDFARGGIAANGDSDGINPPSNPAPQAVIDNNTITGPGKDEDVTWAPNGIQIGWGATGEITNNTVSENGWPGTDWTGSGILVFLSDNVLVEGNTVSTNETGIALAGYMWDDAGGTATGTEIRNNTVDNNEYGISVQDKVVDTVIEDNVITGSTYDGIGVANFYDNPPTGTEIHYNQITGNNTAGDATSGGLWVDSGVATVDAEMNWWGDASGPYHDPDNTVGLGDAVIGDGDFSPWCLNSTCTAVGTINEDGEYVVDDSVDAAGIQDLIDEVPSGAVIILPGKVIAVPGGFMINNPGITLMLSDGTVIQASSPCVTVNADNTTITSAVVGGGVCQPSDGDHGILTGAAVDNLVIKGIEFDGSSTTTGDGIHIGHDVNNLQILDNYIHDMGGDGIEYASGVTVSGVHDVEGNLFAGNTGDGINNQMAASLDATYNAWNHYDGPLSGDGVTGIDAGDYTPWNHVELSMAATTFEAADKVGEGYTITYTVYMDAQSVRGADFDLNFDESKLQVNSVTNSGTFEQNAGCALTYDNVNGEISFCGERGNNGALTGQDQAVFEVVFEGLEAGSVLLDLDAADDVFVGPAGSASNNIYASALNDGAVEVFDTTDVTGRIDLQGRADDAGAVMAFAEGVNQGYGPYTFSTSDYWGAVSVTGVVDDTYLVTVEMDLYLDVTASSGPSDSGITVDITDDDQVLNTLVLLGGDTDNSDVIDISDAGTIGGAYGTTPGDTNWNPDADINGDGVINILDLALMGGNYNATSADAYDSWTP